MLNLLCLPSVVLEQNSFIHSAISIAPLQVLYYSEALPTTERILYRSFTPKRTGNCRKRSKVPTWRLSGSRTQDPPVESYRLNQGATMSHLPLKNWELMTPWKNLMRIMQLACCRPQWSCSWKIESAVTCSISILSLIREASHRCPNLMPKLGQIKLWVWN